MSTDRPHADLPRVIGGSPTDDELAAIAAVFAQLEAERAASIETVEAPDRSRDVPRWSRSLRRTAWDGHYWA